MHYPPAGHPAWESFCHNGFPYIPPEPGTYWYDNCWGSYKEDREPMQITIDRHPDGMMITAINGEPSKADRAMHGYHGRWAPLEWQNCVVPNSVEIVTADPVSSYELI